jgi:molecular chaperone HscB
VKGGERQLELNGISIEETEGIKDPELLMKIMETREELEEATTESAVDLIRSSNLGSFFFVHSSSSSSSSSSHLVIIKMMTKITTTEEIQKVVQELEIVFDEIKPPDLIKAKSLVMKLRYLDNVEGVCREWTPSKGRIEIIH